jgi:tetratricopeptide (TPR) repeat protein
MYAEKFELLEAKIRETAMLISRLREEKRQLEQENEQLRERIDALEEEIRQSRDDSSRYVPNLDNLLQQLETLQAEGGPVPGPVPGPDPVTSAMQDLLGKEAKNAEEQFQLAALLEQKGQFEQAISAYQRTLEVDPQNLEAAQRLAFLLEKLNRDAEASPLWDKIWAMREAQSHTKRRRLR